MEYIQGRELKDYFEANERFSPADIVKIMTQMLDALGYSHRLGVIHRDIKPANVILLTGGGVKVADFGIAHIESSNMTQVGTVMGTPSYMSPEQIMGLPIDGRSDLFSAGVILYQFLTGERPFSGSATATMHKCWKRTRCRRRASTSRFRAPWTPSCARRSRSAPTSATRTPMNSPPRCAPRSRASQRAAAEDTVIAAPRRDARRRPPLPATSRAHSGSRRRERRLRQRQPPPPRLGRRREHCRTGAQVADDGVAIVAGWRCWRRCGRVDDDAALDRTTRESGESAARHATAPRRSAPDGRTRRRRRPHRRAESRSGIRCRRRRRPGRSQRSALQRGQVADAIGPPRRCQEPARREGAGLMVDPNSLAKNYAIVRDKLLCKAATSCRR
jgi:serine/threonine-protein kinase